MRCIRRCFVASLGREAGSSALRSATKHARQPSNGRPPQRAVKRPAARAPASSILTRREKHHCQALRAPLSAFRASTPRMFGVDPPSKRPKHGPCVRGNLDPKMLVEQGQVTDGCGSSAPAASCVTCSRVLLDIAFRVRHLATRSKADRFCFAIAVLGRACFAPGSISRQPNLGQRQVFRTLSSTAFSPIIRGLVVWRLGPRQALLRPRRSHEVMPRRPRASGGGRRHRRRVASTA